ncbi:hypothetical protein B7P43_G17034 [Cryptotermes secundus]|uniref:Uncharacterized protein n=1 Tax=Cryptotermes secundus TaxID=105785 RepID=A0A2J7PGM1_9NEOP|nr:hypothetical protein B7P43_G17034 [Cryptotermes secundus]
MEATCSSEMSVNFQHTLQHYNPEDIVLQNHLPEPQILLTAQHHIPRERTLHHCFCFLDYDITDQCESDSQPYFCFISIAALGKQ